VAQPIPPYFVGIVDPAYPRTLTAQSIVELRSVFREQLTHLGILDTLATGFEKRTSSIATSANSGTLIRVNQHCFPNYAEAVAQVARQEAAAAPEPQLIGFLTNNEDLMDNLLMCMRFPPGPFTIEFSPHAEPVQGQRSEPDRVQSYSEVFDSLIRGLEAERQFVLTYLGGMRAAESPPFRQPPSPVPAPTEANTANVTPPGPESPGDFRRRVVSFVTTYAAETRNRPTITEVARSLGIPRATLYRRIDNDELLRDLFERTSDDS
jgi:hypothetical protein